MPMAAVTGKDHVIRYANPAFCLLTGNSRDNIIGTAFCSALPGSGECVALLDGVLETGQSHVHYGEDHPASHRLYWSYSIWPVIAADGNRMGIVVQITETTPFVIKATAMNQALLISSVRQHELSEAADVMNAQLTSEIAERRRIEQELRRANLDLEQFSHAASHELQEPLRTVTSYVALLMRKLPTPLDPELEPVVRHVVDATRRMSALIKDLLAYAQLGVDSYLAQTPVSAADALNEARYNLEMKIAETHAVITSDMLPPIHADFSQLIRLLQNLIGNSLKYRKPGVAPEIHIGAESRGNEWVFSVRDNGIGINPRYTDQIFGVFKRLHGAEYPGNGIGLAICKRIVERHHGAIWATSQEGEGATFSFTIPKDKPEAAVSANVA